MADPQITSADEIRARKAHRRIVALPSGITVQVGRVALIELAAAGMIPDDLTTETLTSLAEALEGSRDGSPADARRALKRRLDVFDSVAVAVLVEPRASLNGAPGTIHPRDLDFSDRLYLYGLALGTEEGPELDPFPAGPGAGVAAVEDGEGVLDPPVGATRRK